MMQTLWTTNLSQIDGDKNWQVFLGASLVLTLLVFVCWWLYVRVSRGRQKKQWPARATIDAPSHSLV